MERVYNSLDGMRQHLEELLVKFKGNQDVEDITQLAESLGYQEGFDEGFQVGMDRETTC